MANSPPIILWAWERRENLNFIDPQETGVAFLAKTLRVDNAHVTVRPRLQPLLVPPGTFLIAVARIETHSGDANTISHEQHAKLIAEIADLVQLPNIRALQVDFDARASQRGWYRELLVGLRQILPDRIGLSITALASWCLYDDWLSDVPVDEAVPMLFRMGPEGAQVRQHLVGGRDFRQRLCRAGVGTSTDEPLPHLPAGRRRYLFHPQAWTESAAAQAASGER